MKKLKNTNERNIKNWSIKSKSGEVITDRDKVILRWHEFYPKLYHCDRQVFTSYEESTPILSTTPSEIESALKKLNKGKSPDPGNITSELLIAGGPVLQTWLKFLIDNILQNRVIPDELNVSDIVTLFKKGDPLDCGNYRPISLLSHAYKLLMQVVYTRIKKDLIEALPKEQAAYQPGHSTIEQIQSIQQIIEKSIEFQQPCVICFIDYTRTFDSIDQTKLWEILYNITNIDASYINLLAKIYEKAKSKVRTNFGTTNLFGLLKGVRQGDISSAILFCILLLAISIFVYDDIEYGFKIAGMILSYIAFADDLALITYTALEMNILLERLITQSEHFGLSTNISKTKVMFIGNHAEEASCNINGVVLENVDSFQYLGRVITNSNNDTEAVEKLISKGWNAYNKVQKTVLKDRKIPISTKKKTFEAYILPCITYGAETITWRKDLLRKMDVFQNNIMRICTNKRKIDGIPIDTLLMMTRVTPVSTLVKRKS